AADFLEKLIEARDLRGLQRLELPDGGAQAVVPGGAQRRAALEIGGDAQLRVELGLGETELRDSDIGVPRWEQSHWCVDMLHGPPGGDLHGSQAAELEVSVSVLELVVSLQIGASGGGQLDRAVEAAGAEQPGCPRRAIGLLQLHLRPAEPRGPLLQ